MVFALNGQVLSCLGYPHYEIALSAGLCLLLAGLATDRVRLAWAGLALAAMTREDGGFHAAGMVAATLLCGWSKRPFPVGQRTLLTMFAVAAAASVIAVLLQKTMFVTAPLFEQEYLGEPAYAHMTREVLLARLVKFTQRAQFVFFPLAASVLIAIVRRDARNLLGWLAELPWLILNLLAAQQLKSSFEIYTGFPFVASIFWLGAYGRVVSPAPDSRRWLLPLIAVSMASTLGLASSHTRSFQRILERSLWPVDVPYRELQSFAGRLARDPNAHGYLLVDGGMASWAIEHMPPERRISDLREVTSFRGRDGLVFFRRGFRGNIERFIAKSPFRNCGRIADTPVFICLRGEATLPPEFVKASLAD